jgi:hypothetical protein
MADTNKYFPANFGTRGAEEVGKLNALVDTANTAASGVTTEVARAEAAEALLAPIASPAFTGLVDVPLATTAAKPAYVEGRMYYDTTLHKLRIGGAAAYETVTSV